MEFSESNAIGIDVGGTTIDAGVVVSRNADHSAQMVGNASRMQSPSEKPFGEMISDFGNLIVHAKHDAEELGYHVNVVGVAMPGPFEYPRGVSRMEHKFQDAFGKNMLHPLREIAEVPVFFVNDADAFGLGVYSKLFPSEERLLALTLGTGLGSAFVVGGEIAAELESETDSIPNDGEVWNLPYGESILEDYVSKRAIEGMYAKNSGRTLEVYEIAELARNHDTQALAAFTTFGENLGKGLESFIKEFHPTRIVLGGQIAKSLDLFEEPIRRILQERNSDIPISAAVEENYAIYGAAYYASMRAEASQTP